MINILFGGNSKVFDGFLTCILSIFKRSKIQDEYTFYILTMSLTRKDSAYTPISDKEIEFLNEVCQEYNPNNKVIKIDVTEMYEQYFAYCPNEDAYCSPYTLIRLFADILPLPDKILYLDADVIFNGDIHNLYEINVDDYEYAAARDFYGRMFVHPNYINAGVMLFNLKKIRETKLLEKARKLIQTKRLHCADQSAIIRSTTSKKIISQRFNDQRYLYKDTIIRHFSKHFYLFPYPHYENVKQWDIYSVHKKFHYYQFDDILYEYVYLITKFKKQCEIKQ